MEEVITDVGADHFYAMTTHILASLISLNENGLRHISGISIDAFIIGTLAYIGYSFIGLKYALVFAIFLDWPTLIPYVGPTIG